MVVFMVIFMRLFLIRFVSSLMVLRFLWYVFVGMLFICVSVVRRC